MDRKIVEIYENELDNQPMAHDELIEARNKLDRALEAYIEEIQVSMFVWGYETGRRDTISKGGTTA